MSRWSRLGGAWPSDTQALLLLAAVSEADAARDAWRRWCEVADIDTADLDSQRLLPLVYRNLAGGGFEDPEMARLKGAYRISWYRNQMLLRQAAPAVELLLAAGLETMLLKGAALSAALYRDVGVRPMSDLDVWVPQDRAREAMLLLEEEGWRAAPGWSAASPQAKDAMRVLHGEAFEQGPTTVDLHWQVLRQPVVPEDFWEHSMPVRVGTLELRTLCPADQLVNVCDHGADGVRTPIRWAADTVTVLRSSEVDWYRVLDVARRQRIALTLAEFLEYARAVLGAPVPGDALGALRALGSSPRDRRAHRAATRRANPSRAVRIVWGRYRRLAEFEGRPVRLHGFPRYMQLTMGFPTRRALVAHGLRRLGDVARLKASPGRRRAASR